MKIYFGLILVFLVVPPIIVGAETQGYDIVSKKQQREYNPVCKENGWII